MLKLYRKRKRAGVTLYSFDTDAIVVKHENGVYINISDKLSDLSDFKRYKGKRYFVRVGSLFSRDASVYKLSKTRKLFRKLRSIIHYSAPAQSASINGLRRIESCKYRTKVCTLFCLVSSGKGTLPAVKLARIARTRLRVFAPNVFWAMWRSEYDSEKRAAVREGLKLACRPNGTSDFFCQGLRSEIERNADDSFYDYSAVPSRLSVGLPNYTVTMSVKETTSNHDWIKSNLYRANAAAVVSPDLHAQLIGDKKRYFDAFVHDFRHPSADGVAGRVGLLKPIGELRGKTNGMVFTDRNALETAVLY